MFFRSRLSKSFVFCFPTTVKNLFVWFVFLSLFSKNLLICYGFSFQNVKTFRFCSGVPFNNSNTFVSWNVFRSSFFGRNTCVVVTIRCPWWWWVSLPGPSCLSGPVRHVYPLVSRAGILVMTVRVSCRFGRCLRVVTTTSSGGAGILVMTVRVSCRFGRCLRVVTTTSSGGLLSSFCCAVHDSRVGARCILLFFFCDRSLWWPSDGTSRCVLCYFCSVLDNPGTCRICGDLFVECVDSYLFCGLSLGLWHCSLCLCRVLFCLRPCAHGHFGPGEESTDSSHSLANFFNPPSHTGS